MNLEHVDLESTIYDPRWRLNNIYYVVSKKGHKVRFIENEIQKRLNDSPAKRKMILKARQFGISTNEILKLFDYVCFNANSTACILAHEQDSIRKLFRIVKRAYDFMNPILRPVLDRGGGSQYEFYFPEINSRIYCDLESRSDTIQRLLVSEVVFFKDPEKLKSTLQTVPIDSGFVSLETTPNGMGNHFYEMWSESDIYEKFFFPWFLFKDYQIPTTQPLVYTDEEVKLVAKALDLFSTKITDQQIAFRRFKKNEIKNYFIQEYPEDDNTCFLASGQAAMDLGKVSKLLQLDLEPINKINELLIYEEPKKNTAYVCGADTAEGINNDYCVATVFDKSARKQVAMLRGHFRPIDFAHKINDLCERYQLRGQFPLLAVEENNHGHAVLLELKEHIKYNNLYYHDKKNERPGWRTDRVTRPIMLGAFIDAIENGTAQIVDKQTLKECLTLINNNGKIEAASGHHDDCVIACAIAIQMLLVQIVDLDFYNNIEKKILM